LDPNHHGFLALSWIKTPPEQVDEVHQQFTVALTQLFDKHKHQYGWSNRKLTII
jgi:hypothetical protein